MVLDRYLSRPTSFVLFVDQGKSGLNTACQSRKLRLAHEFGAVVLLLCSLELPRQVFILYIYVFGHRYLATP